jgi:hypothetical protein
MPFRLPIRRACAALAVTAGLLAGVPASAVAAPAPAPDQRAQRAELLLRIADVTDQLEQSDAAVVAAEARAGDASSALAGVRTRMRERAVLAYMRGTAAGVQELAAPAAYLDVAAKKERDLVDGYRSARQQAVADQATVERARRSQRQAAAELDSLRATLDKAIAIDDARLAEQAAAAEARKQAMAAAAAQRARAAAGRGPSANGYDPNPADPASLTARHRAAPAAQQALMKRWPFGPLPAGTALPPGLHATGVHVEGIASWYGPDFDGRPTASGAIYDMEGWTVASPDLPLGSFLVVSSPTARVLLLVNDRGPYVAGRVLDLSHAASVALGVSLGPVSADVVAPS